MGNHSLRLSTLNKVFMFMFKGENLKLLVKEEQSNNLKKLEEALEEQKTKHQVSLYVWIKFLWL